MWKKMVETDGRKKNPKVSQTQLQIQLLERRADSCKPSSGLLTASRQVLLVAVLIRARGSKLVHPRNPSTQEAEI